MVCLVMSKQLLGGKILVKHDSHGIYFVIRFLHHYDIAVKKLFNNPKQVYTNMNVTLHQIL